MLKLKISCIILLIIGQTYSSSDQFAEGSQSRDLLRIYGNMVAAFTPTDEDNKLDFTNLEKLAARFQEWGVKNVMIGGTTGESVSFSTQERMQVVQEWLKLVDEYDINLYVHVGMNSVQEAADFTKQLASAKCDGVKGIFSMPPVYFKPSNINALVDTMSVIANQAPDLPFWYYHFPANTGVELNMFEFVKAVDESGRMPNFMGVKFTYEHIQDLNAIGQYKNRKYNMLMGRDEMLTSALATGVCDGAVGSTFNFMSINLPLIDLYNTYNKESIMEANSIQNQTVQIIEAWGEGSWQGYNVQKALLKMSGIDFGPLRLPQENLNRTQMMELGTRMKALGMNITDEYVYQDNDNYLSGYGYEFEFQDNKRDTLKSLLN